jgi:hypothetical protein
LYEAIDGLRKQNSISKVKISHLADDKPTGSSNSKPIEVKKSVVATEITITTVVATNVKDKAGVRRRYMSIKTIA